MLGGNVDFLERRAWTMVCRRAAMVEMLLFVDMYTALGWGLINVLVELVCVASQLCCWTVLEHDVLMTQSTRRLRQICVFPDPPSPDNSVMSFSNGNAPSL